MNPMDIVMQLLKEEIDISGQHSQQGDPQFWETMGHFGDYDKKLIDKPFLPYNKVLSTLGGNVDDLLDDYGYEAKYFGGQYGNPNLKRENYGTGHLQIYDPGVKQASFGDVDFTDNWRKVHELGHALGYDQLNEEYGEGRRLGRLGQRSPREMLRAVRWEELALQNQRKLMDELGLPIQNQEYNRDWNTTIGDAAFRAITGKFSTPSDEGFSPHSNKRIPREFAQKLVQDKADELGLGYDETLRDKKGGARKVASEPMDIAYQLLKAREYDVGGRMVPSTQRTLTGQSIADRASDLQMGIPFRQRMEPRAPKQDTGLNYHVSIPKEDLVNPLYSRRYAIRRGDTNEIVGNLPMNPAYTYPRGIAGAGLPGGSIPTGDYKPSYSRIDPEHKGQNLYARALMGLLSAGDIGAPIVSTERNASSEGAHRSLMDMYSRAGGNLESLTGYEPPSESDAVRYNQIFNDGYGSLRAFDPGGLPVRTIDLPSRRSGPDYAQTDLEDFGLTRSEPMDIAYQLLKDDRDDELDYLARMAMILGLADNWRAAMKIAEQQIQSNPLFNAKHPGNQTPSVHPAAPELYPNRKYFPTTLTHEDATEGIQRRVNPFNEEEGTFEGLPFKGDFKKMSNVYVIKKERKSPEAFRRKKEYDTKYESSPERIKYREDLNRERRHRGMYGDHSHRDISHTEGGKLTVENEHENRARHFKSKGTLRPLTKSMRQDLELLRNLMGGPMDEQDKKIAQALITSLDEYNTDTDTDTDTEDKTDLKHPYPF